ncbi:DUF4244 domain-containing protein [Umezawaea sp. Da 62-37]|uniref:DUF4244 domain-containing protein n=1 Tax=Umezawaea sp. Da 62-37 TaxID=3075927 RepID=UPI0028F6E553|nr:DUF4244 domain-containing protein [Umezawaea sp. Da 62-37]WNV91722.1 DUF4244 domain-containing protein [Umezawaea sp. Da 62-37]
MYRTIHSALRDDSGMISAEYALGTLAAAALATTLYLLASSDAVSALLKSLLDRALAGPT